MRGWCNERTVRDNAITSWCDKMKRGQRNERTTRGQCNERTTRGNATSSWCDKMTRERRNEGTTRGDATTSWHDERTPGQCDERQHNLVLIGVQTEVIGEVAAMVIARIERKPE